MRKALFSMSFLLLLSFGLSAQKDTLIFGDNDYMIGEFKELSNGNITVETGYSDSDFIIEWKK